MTRLHLSQKYAPMHLSEMRGQKFVVDYFKAVVRNPDAAFRNYIILGGYGLGKTSLAHAFANDLLGVDDARQTPNFIELDSYQVKDRERMLALKDYIFTEVPGYKVVLLDEFHLIDQTDQAGLLKDIESCTLPIFFLFASTDRNGILDTMFSRSIDFTLQSFPREELALYLDEVCGKEGIEIRQDTKDAILFRSFGHLRNLLNQLDLAASVGDDLYTAETSRVFSLVESLFREPSKDVVSGLALYPYTFVQECIDQFLHRRIIHGRELFNAAAIPQIFAFYLRFKRYLKNENDFLSFLYLFSDHLALMRRQHGI